MESDFVGRRFWQWTVPGQRLTTTFTCWRAWNRAGEATTDVMFARSTDGGLTFSAPHRINDDPNFQSKWHWFGTFSVAPNGRIDAVWYDTRNAANNIDSQLFYSCSTDAGVTWAPNVAVSNPFNPQAGFPNNQKIGDYITIVSDNTGANVAYAATFNVNPNAVGGHEQDVYYVRVSPSGGPTPTPTATASPTSTPTATATATATATLANSHGYSYSHSYGHINSNSYCYSQTDADAEISGDAETATHATTPAVATALLSPCLALAGASTERGGYKKKSPTHAAVLNFQISISSPINRR